MKKIILLVSSLVLLGVGCSQKLTNNQLPPTTTTAGATKNLNYYVANFRSGAEIDIVELEKNGKLKYAFSTQLDAIPCDPTDENGENYFCCDKDVRVFVPKVSFYTWDSTDWKKGGKVDFYIDSNGSVCADGGLLPLNGPFKDDLLLLSKEAVR